jgi:hypothetical protein
LSSNAQGATSQHGYSLLFDILVLIAGLWLYLKSVEQMYFTDGLRAKDTRSPKTRPRKGELKKDDLVRSRGELHHGS